LAHITGAYRDEATGMTPNLLMIGREVHMPIDLLLRTIDKDKTNPGDYVLHLRQTLERSYSIAHEKIATAAKRHCVFL
jgi:hypothetical protein